MVVSTLRRSLHIVALTMCSAVIAATATPASARPHHGSGHHAHRSHGGHHYARHHHHRRSVARMSRWERGVARMQVSGVDDAQASVMMPGTASDGMATSGGFGGSSVVSAARSFIGSGNPTGRRSLWCARFMNMVLERTGHHGTGSDMARSFASYGQRVSGPQVGAIAVMSRRGGGHVGVVSGVDAQGNPIVISGNNGNRVRESAVSRGRIYAYVVPN
ncbi:TIGR02594 family protein [Bradyrhizobium ontarionense]|uniref:TIGR02594 family protein n=1 Tax=Bradyrhizobium ontarionense TaxID=2898149 RepID=A0ABY3R7X0_9BRAD|nr:TIGR02594 family protein [Bradyrhizobium sp. A19]UFZ03274.1 TIGR02594 family protein [Bradyrhizobium sp. A19]